MSFLVPSTSFNKDLVSQSSQFPLAELLVTHAEGFTQLGIPVRLTQLDSLDYVQEGSKRVMSSEII